MEEDKLMEKIFGKEIIKIRETIKEVLPEVLQGTIVDYIIIDSFIELLKKQKKGGK